MLERYLIEHCSPTLASVKTANLFTWSFAPEEMPEQQVRYWNQELQARGISLVVLRVQNQKALMYVCRKQRLQERLDDQEVQTGHRDDGTVYAVYSFARKVGQALAGGIGGWALQVIGYEPAAAAQTDAVRRGLYTTATLVPAIGFFVVAAILWFVYPLDKRRVEKNVEELKKKHLPAEH